MTKSFLTILVIFSTQTRYTAELTDYEIGGMLTNLGNDIGLEFRDANGDPFDIAPAFDKNVETSIRLENQESVEFYLPRKEGKVPYPTSGFHISNGDLSGKGRIKVLRVDVKNGRFSRSWEYQLHDTLQWQYIRFPETFWLGKSGSIILTPVELYNSTESESKISELAFSWE